MNPALSDSQDRRLTLEDILPFLQGKKISSSGQITATCPVCGKEKHLYVNEKNGQLLVYCQKCNAPGTDIIKAFRALGAKHEVEERPKVLVEDYDHVYKNPDGSEAYRKRRKKWNDGSKYFMFSHVENGRTVQKKPEGCNNLYNLDLLQQAIDKGDTAKVYIVEGEKCADAMTNAGLLTTTSNTGAQKRIKLSDTDSKILGQFKTKIVIPDNDEKGTDYALAWGDDVKIIKLSDIWPECPRKGDIADYLNLGFSVKPIVDYEFKEPIKLDSNYLDTLTATQLLGSELMDALYAIESPAERSRMVALVRNRARALSVVKDWNKVWQSHLQAKATALIRSDNWTKFPNQEFKLRCGEWECDERGVRKGMSRNGEEFKYEWASPIPIMPVEILENIEDDTERIRIAFCKQGVWKTIPVVRSTAASSSKIIELADSGVEVNSDNSKLLVKFLADLVALNPDILPRTKSVDHLGWVEKEFLPYSEDIKSDVDYEYKHLIDSLTEKGSLQEWLDYVQPLRKNIYFRMIMAASFASPLIEKVGALPFVLHLWGGTGSGKTVAMMVAASVWGNPKQGRLVRTMNSTINAMMGTAAMLRNLPFFGDELQTIKSRYDNYDVLIMRICEGVDRGRMSSGSVLQKQRCWNNSFIFTGEEPCTQSMSGGGVKNRVIEIECDHQVVANGNNVVNFITSHYGCAGREFIKALESVDLKAEYQGIYQMVLDVTKTTEKQAMAMALLLLADVISGRMLWKVGDFLTPEDVMAFVKSVDEVDTAKRAYGMILDIMAENHDKFDPDEKGINWGKILNDVESGKQILRINKTVLERELRSMDFDFNAVKRKWAERGYLRLNSQGRYFTQTAVGGIRGAYVDLIAQM